MKKTTFNTIKNITKFDFPCISQFDLDLIYETNDIEFLCKVLEKLNEIIDSQNLIVEDFNKIVKFVNEKIEEYTKEVLENWLYDGTLENLILALGNVVKYIDTVKIMKTLTNLVNGMTIKTKGFEEIGDGHDSTYIITNIKYEDGVYISLLNNLYARPINFKNELDISSIFGSNVTDEINDILKNVRSIYFRNLTYNSVNLTIPTTLHLIHGNNKSIINIDNIDFGTTGRSSTYVKNINFLPKNNTSILFTGHPTYTIFDTIVAKNYNKVFNLSRAWGCSILNSHFWNNKTVGDFINDENNCLIINNCHFYDADSGLILTQGRDISITECIFERCKVGMSLSGSPYNLNISNNYFEAVSYVLNIGKSNYELLMTFNNNYILGGKTVVDGYIVNMEMSSIAPSTLGNCFFNSNFIIVANTTAKLFKYNNKDIENNIFAHTVLHLNDNVFKNLPYTTYFDLFVYSGHVFSINNRFNIKSDIPLFKKDKVQIFASNPGKLFYPLSSNNNQLYKIKGTLTTNTLELSRIYTPYTYSNNIAYAQYSGDNNMYPIVCHITSSGLTFDTDTSKTLSTIYIELEYYIY